MPAKDAKFWSPENFRLNYRIKILVYTIKAAIQHLWVIKKLLIADPVFKNAKTDQ